MTLQNVRNIKGAADKNGLKDAMFEQGIMSFNFFKKNLPIYLVAMLLDQ